MTSSAFDTSQVKDKRETINGRFQRIKSMAAARRAKLNESHRLHQFFRDMDDEESWIKCVFWIFWALVWGNVLADSLLTTVIVCGMGFITCLFHKRVSVREITFMSFQGKLHSTTGKLYKRQQSSQKENGTETPSFREK